MIYELILIPIFMLMVFIWLFTRKQRTPMNWLPCRFKHGDKVIYFGKECVVAEVIFTESKVYYTLVDKLIVHERVDGVHVEPLKD